MRLLLIIGIAAAGMVLQSCTSSSGGKKRTIEMAEPETVQASGIQQMPSQETEDEVTFKGKKFRSRIVRRADESLPTVQGATGDKYVDNRITLTLTSDGKQVLNKEFLKSSFSEYVDADFYKKAILEGLVLDKVTPQGIVYAASLSYPDTDLYIPLQITVTADMKLKVEKSEVLNETYDVPAEE